MGAKGGAEVGLANDGIGIPYIAEARIQDSGTSAKVGFSLQYAGTSVGASLAEAQARPFAVRVDVRFGVGVRNCSPQIYAGPVSVPCCVQ